MNEDSSGCIMTGVRRFQLTHEHTISSMQVECSAYIKIGIMKNDLFACFFLVIVNDGYVIMAVND